MSPERPPFRTTRVLPGYDPAQVDAAVDLVMENLALAAPRIGVAEVEALSFRTVSYRTGYDMEQVDDWLADVADDLRRRNASPELPAPVPPPAPALPHPAAVTEVRGASSRQLLVLGVLVVVLAVLAYVALA
jgi:DivIVA domain-containing protein